MGKLKQLLTELKHLDETLDQPWQLTDTTDDPKLARAVSQAKQDGYRHLKIYRAQNQEMVIVGIKDGAWEIHHADKDGKSGYVAGGPNATGFVSTMFSIAAQKLSCGYKVRIIMPEVHKAHYRRLIQTVAKRYGWHVGKEYTVQHQGKEYDAVDIIESVKTDLKIE